MVSKSRSARISCIWSAEIDWRLGSGKRSPNFQEESSSPVSRSLCDHVIWSGFCPRPDFFAAKDLRPHAGPRQQQQRQCEGLRSQLKLRISSWRLMDTMVSWLQGLLSLRLEDAVVRTLQEETTWCASARTEGRTSSCPRGSEHGCTLLIL